MYKTIYVNIQEEFLKGTYLIWKVHSKLNVYIDYLIAFK